MNIADEASDDDQPEDANYAESTGPTVLEDPESSSIQWSRRYSERVNRRIDKLLADRQSDLYGTFQTVESVVDDLSNARIRQMVQERLEARERAADQAPPLEAGTLAELMERPKDPPFRIEGLQPSRAALLVVAQRKTGKTTLALNYARCLLTGEDFLGRFPVRSITGRVALINFELSTDQLVRWSRDIEIPGDGLFLANFRGRRNPLANHVDRRELVERLRDHGVESIVIDPFGRAYTGRDQNSSGEVSAWLADLDYFVRGEVGAQDLLLTAHAGWAKAGRARGSSALEDWADAVLYMTRDGHDPSARYLRAEGRDVLVQEDRLDFDPERRLMTLTGSGGQRQAQTSASRGELTVEIHVWASW
jgi:AAA domain